MKPLHSVFGLFIASVLFGYEVDIENGPTLDAGPNSHFEVMRPVEDGTPLIDFLERSQEIERILIGTPSLNSGQVEFSEALVRRRLEEAVCVNSQKDSWHFAPYTMGTIYWKDGSKHNFTMYLSGIAVGDHLFARKQKVEPVASDNGD